MHEYEQLNVNQSISEVDQFTEERYRLFHRFLPRQIVNILDVGCNTGRGGQFSKVLMKDESYRGSTLLSID